MSVDYDISGYHATAVDVLLGHYRAAVAMLVDEGDGIGLSPLQMRVLAERGAVTEAERRDLMARISEAMPGPQPTAPTHAEIAYARERGLIVFVPVVDTALIAPRRRESRPRARRVAVANGARAPGRPGDDDPSRPSDLIAGALALNVAHGGALLDAIERDGDDNGYRIAQLVLLVEQSRTLLDIARRIA